MGGRVHLACVCVWWHEGVYTIVCVCACVCACALCVCASMCVCVCARVCVCSVCVVCVCVCVCVCMCVCVCVCVAVCVCACMYEYACGFHWHTGTWLHACVLEGFLKLCHSQTTNLVVVVSYISHRFTHTLERNLKRFCCNSEFNGFNRSSDNNSQVYTV